MIGVFAILLSATLVGCNKTESNEKKEIIGIIGAMDVEVNSLKESAKISETRKIVEYKVFEEQAAKRCAKIVRYMVENV